MKVSFEISDIQVLKVCALYPATEKQTEAIMAAVHETPELNLTEQCKSKETYADLCLAVAAFAVATLIQKYQSDTSV